MCIFSQGIGAVGVGQPGLARSTANWEGTKMGAPKNTLCPIPTTYLLHFFFFWLGQNCTVCAISGVTHKGQRDKSTNFLSCHNRQNVV